jgi:hypothetical protein
MSNLIYIHIGKILPEYIYDSIYQSILVSKCTKIYVILDDSLIQQFTQKISNFNINLYTTNIIHFEFNIQCIPLSILQLPDEYTNLINNLPTQTKTFRNSFWIYTIARFFYIFSFMQLFKIDNAFHIENDIMIYEDLYDIENNLDKRKLYMIKDNIDRVIASLMYLNIQEFEKVLQHIISELQLNNNLNDMQLLGLYKSKHNLVEFLPFDMTFTKTGKNNYIYDSAAIGQFLGGIDPRNISEFNNKSIIEQKLLTYNNPTINFINETCTFKPNTVKFFKKGVYLDNIYIPLELLYSKRENKDEIQIKDVVNLHIHSKQLYQFSSVFNINYKDIITGDRILQLCDFVLSTPEIFNYHRNIDKFIKLEQVIIVENFKKINIDTLNSYFKEVNKKVIKLFIYTHILDLFIQYILPYLDNSLNYILYLHNSDHSLTQEHYNILNPIKYIKKVYSQNINCEYSGSKFELLPIGLANSMFGHGDILSLYETMSKTYYLSKTKNLYININPKTFPYRQEILNQVNTGEVSFNITNAPKPFNQYLEELSTHRFSLCVRGNGLDTHRNIESLYLGVIPVIINNKFTNMDNHVQYLRSLNIPFYEIKEETLDKYSDEFFNEKLYKKIMKECCSSIYNLPQLKLSYYS